MTMDRTTLTLAAGVGAIASVLFGTSDDAYAWHRLEPATACVATINSYASGSGYIQANYSSGFAAQAECPFVQEGAAVGTSSWTIYDNQIVSLYVDVYNADGIFIEAYACYTDTSGGACGSGWGSSSTGNQSLEAPSGDLTYWTNDTNATRLTYVQVSFGTSHQNDLYGIRAYNY